jgi:hypothetical protein
VSAPSGKVALVDAEHENSAGLTAPGNVFYFVADLDRAVAWYTARLGAVPVRRAA